MYAADLIHQNPYLESKLQKLFCLNRSKAIDLSFRPPFLDLLEAFGNPQRKLPPVIHVAGTNGKGSVIAFLRAIYENSGKSVHSYTSPHLVKFNERIVLNGRPISDELLEAFIDQALLLNDSREITFFEITTVLAFCAFTSQPADILLLEVGMGGRLDCTNVIEHSALSVITPVSMDHMEYLGNDLQQIATEKAGIIKPSIPCVVGPQSHTALKAIEVRAKELNAPLYRFGSEWSIEPQKNRFIVHFMNHSFEIGALPLAGRHQVDNAATALVAACLMHQRNNGFELPDPKSLQKAFWPARIQEVTQSFPQAEESGWQVFLDGGHNEEAAKVIAHHVQKWKEDEGKDTHLIFGMMAHKDPKTYLAPLAPHVKTITLTSIPGEPQAFNSQALQAIIEKIDPAIQTYTEQSLQKAVRSLIETHPHAGRILIAGSLYLAGHVLKQCALVQEDHSPL